MNANEFIKLRKAINEGILNSNIKKWVSHDNHEEITSFDSDGNRFEIKFYPAEGSK